MYEIEKVEQFQMYGIIFSYMSIVISFSTDIANTGYKSCTAHTINLVFARKQFGIFNMEIVND